MVDRCLAGPVRRALRPERFGSWESFWAWGGSGLDCDGDSATQCSHACTSLVGRDLWTGPLHDQGFELSSACFASLDQLGGHARRPVRLFHLGANPWLDDVAADRFPRHGVSLSISNRRLVSGDDSVGLLLGLAIRYEVPVARLYLLDCVDVDLVCNADHRRQLCPASLARSLASSCGLPLGIGILLVAGTARITFDGLVTSLRNDGVSNPSVSTETTAVLYGLILVAFGRRSCSSDSQDESKSLDVGWIPIPSLTM